MIDSVSSITGEKLNRDNYPRWKFNMRSFLKGQGLQEIVTGKEELTENASREDEMTYVKRSNQALHYISITIMPSLIHHIQNAEIPKEAWDTISTIFEASTKARKLQLKRQFHEVKKGSMTMEEYLLHIQDFVD